MASVVKVWLQPRFLHCNLGVREVRVEVRPRGLPLPWLLVSGGCGGAMAAWGWAGPLEPAPSGAWAWPPGSGGWAMCGLRDRSLSLSIWNCFYSLFLELFIILMYDTFHQRGRGHEVTGDCCQVPAGAQEARGHRQQSLKHRFNEGLRRFHDHKESPY